MRRYPFGVAVATVDVDGNRLGLTVSSLVSLALEPPFVGLSIWRQAAFHELLREAGGFAVSLLADDQLELAQHFARGVPPIAMWHGLDVREGDRGPLLEGAVGWLECELDGELEAGDHTFFLGRVERVEPGADTAAAAAARRRLPPRMIDAVVFDMDGVIVDSEQVWDDVREQLAKERGGRWHDGAQAAMMGMSSPEWSAYMHDEIGLPESPDEINAEVVERMLERYREELPLIDGAVEAVRRLAPEFRLGVASSSNRPLIETVLERAEIADVYDAVVSSEEVARGKPAPDVYLEAMRRLGAEPASTAAIEDSSNGIRAAHAAGMRVIALPNAHYPPAPDALALADAVIASPDELTPELVRG